MIISRVTWRGSGLAEAGAVRQDEVGLELGETGVGNSGVGEQAKAGVHAVDGFAAGDDALDRRRGGGNAIHAGGIQLGGSAFP